MTAIELAVKNNLVKISLNFVGSSVTRENEKNNVENSGIEKL